MRVNDATNNCATLGKNGKYIVFKYCDTVLRFKSPYSLDRITQIKTWDKGYLVVMAKYLNNPTPEEDYIDIVPILEDLYINPEVFLKPIKNVVLE